VLRLDVFAAIEVRDGSRHLQDAVMSAGRKSQSGNRIFQQLFAFGRNPSAEEGARSSLYLTAGTSM
jgi:hypothetical protein